MAEIKLKLSVLGLISTTYSGMEVFIKSYHSYGLFSGHIWNTSRRYEAHHLVSWAVWTDEAMSVRLEITLVIHLAVSSGSSTEREYLASFLNTPGKGFPWRCDRTDTWNSLQVLWWVRCWVREKMWNLKTWTKPREYKLVFNWTWIALFSIVLRDLLVESKKKMSTLTDSYLPSTNLF